MAQIIPTTQEIKDQNLANLESKLNQLSPLADKAFLRVLAGMEALGFTSLYKYGVERTLQNLALTATGDDLETIGLEFDVLRKAAEATVLTITLPGTDTTVIPAGTDFIGDSNGVRYFSDSSATITGGIATISVTAEIVGVIGNLNVSDTLTIATQVPGAGTQATVIVIDNTGAEKEEEEIYRVRVLFAIRATAGGSNATDHKIWSEGVAGVAKSFPYAGKPFGTPSTSFPGDRTVYIEADTTIDADGIPPQSLLDEVRTALNTDPDTGRSRPVLGITDETLYVEPIIRTEFYVEIRGLIVSADLEAQTKADIESALTLYFLSLNPFVEGIDLLQERNDLITELTVGDIVQGILSAVGGSAEGARFGLSVGSFESSYVLSPGEKGKLATGGIAYA